MQETKHEHAGGRPIRRVVIAGGGTAGWMMAAGLSKSLGKLLDIKLVESDEIGTVGVGEATIPTLMNFHHLLEINEQEFMAATGATFKLGISFENWRNVGEDYIHSFGSTGIDHWTAGFQHFWHKGRERGLAGDFGNYCLELRAAQENRFAHLPKDGMNYAYHLDASAYARYLRKFSERFGVQRIEGKIVDVALDGPGGDIGSIRLDSGTVLEGDLFIDCTGFRGLLIGQALGIEYEDWSHWLFNDSAAALQTPRQGPAVPMTRAIARDAGWQWRIPLQHRVGNGIVFSRRFTDDEAAVKTLLANIEGEPLMAPRVIRFQPGQRKKVWHRNCIAVGLASGFLEPIESTSIHLIQRSIIRLMQCFPTQGIQPSDVEEFNRQTETDIASIRDFIILHYKVTNRRDTPYWRAAAEMAVPASLQHRIDLFRETGRVFRIANELFAENSWIQVMLGQGIMPQQHHQTADLMGDEELAHFLNGISQGIERTVAQLPPHEAYVRQYCAA
ncbi:tryptophan 7-halogenase [Massilia sp. Dwa41.01b]|uniref:tryptophan halogenase family protein n=1 Tax=unclassified Massilia TaxID=2609279 RepID=UPI0016039506|nr:MULTISPECIES: tryptophan halogenase family protein [unclassified Massilia]QNA88271.1 tryptophan 7-halogenase [Massilia sp. Dwa41.01b]QNA99173.1 tryptophan 7-halogenase [Massilia sp. Se16.2.3]